MVTSCRERLRGLVVALVVLLLMCCRSSALGEDRFARLDAYIEAALEKWQVPGLAIAVVKDGEVVLSRGYGKLHSGGSQPVTKESVFPIASCTKSFTAAGIAMLVDERRLEWDDPVQRHFPGFRVADEYVTEHATIRDLLCHRTGLVRGDLLFVKGDFDNEEILHRLQFLPSAAPFRTKVTYNNLMYGVLGKIIERKSGQRWQEFVAARIFEPLGMDATTTDRLSVPAELLATRHRIYDGRLAPLKSAIHDELNAPAGAIYSSAADMAQWLRLQLDEGEFSGRRLISQDAVQEMHALQQAIPVKLRPNARVYDPRMMGTGLGWYVRDYRGRKLVQHGGGWGAEIGIVPEENLAVVVLSNRDGNGLVWMLVFDMIDAYVLDAERAWSRDQWDFWMQLGGPEAVDRTLREQLAALAERREKDTAPTLPLDDYAGSYESPLYGKLELTRTEDRLAVRFGEFSAELTHWQRDEFYGHAVVEPFLDWHVKFDVSGGRAMGLEIVHVGWKEPDERFLFRRAGDN